jgi:DNA-directed RNA polymerase subunit K
MLEALEDKFTKYEVARILGARALQIAMDAPMLLKIDEKELEAINFNPLEIAKRELLAEVLPITVKRPMPKKKEAKIKKLTKEELDKIKKKEEVKLEEQAQKSDDKKIEKVEAREEKKVTEEGEIMELATPDDESEEETAVVEEE